MWQESPFGDVRDVQKTMDMTLISIQYGAQGQYGAPDNIPLPCRYTSCVRKTCTCRVKGIPCTDYCKCVGYCMSPFSLVV